MIEGRPLVAKLDCNDKLIERPTSLALPHSLAESFLHKSRGPKLEIKEVRQLKKKFVKKTEVALGYNSIINI